MWRKRTELLIGAEGLERLSLASVAVIGLGGVGGFAAEMIARAGVGQMVILDSDKVSVSNKNRQLLALESTLGRPKTEVMAERLADINGELKIEIIDEYLTDENVAALLDEHKIDFIIDAIDTLSPKIALIRYAVERRIPLVSSMGAGAKCDATKVKIADISKSFNCPLAYVLRKKLRKYGINKGFKVVFSEELPDNEAIVPVEDRNKRSQVGTISYLPAMFGITAAQVVITSMLDKEE
jgi:Dinucleotide-utilizing enzymes involved in molybdopterin and thiamine biosynthesis family 1